MQFVTVMRSEFLIECGPIRNAWQGVLSWQLATVMSVHERCSE